MPRKPRQASESGVYHFITRGVNKKKLFHCNEDFKVYLSLLKEYAEVLSIKIHHYCLMTNHVHLVLHTEELSTLSRFAYFTQRRYAYHYCKVHNWSEQVFRRNFSSFPIQDDIYLLECGRYVERNPLKANLVKDLKDYPYTSYSHYAYGQINALIVNSPVYETFGNSIYERMAAYRFYVTCQRIQEIGETLPF